MEDDSVCDEKKTGEKKLPMLAITGVSGAAHLFYQFNIDRETENPDAYRVFGLLVLSDLRSRYRKEGNEKYGMDDFYHVTKTENCSGFCINIVWGGASGKDDALRIISESFDYVLGFDPDEHTYGDKDTENLVRNNLAAAQKLTVSVRREIFEEDSVTYEHEYWDPFD